MRDVLPAHSRAPRRLRSGSCSPRQDRIGDGMTTTSQEVKSAKQSSQAGQARLLGLVSRVRELGLLIVLLLIVLIVGVQARRFLSFDNFAQILLTVDDFTIVAVEPTSGGH